MTNILIRGVSDDQVERLDRIANDLGVSRNELLRRKIGQLVDDGGGRVTVEDLRQSAALTADLLDESVMRGAWT